MGKKVLLADDSATIQKLVEMALGDSDEYELLAVSDGKQAIDQLESFQPDIILADAIMPMLDGYEVCRHVKENPQFRNVPVILLTGRFQPFDSDRADAVAIDERVVKPFSQDQLLTMIERLTEGAGGTPVVEPPANEDENNFDDETVHIDTNLDESAFAGGNETVAYSPDMLQAMAGPEDSEELLGDTPDLDAFMLEDEESAEPLPDQPEQDAPEEDEEEALELTTADLEDVAPLEDGDVDTADLDIQVLDDTITVGGEEVAIEDEADEDLLTLGDDELATADEVGSEDITMPIRPVADDDLIEEIEDDEVEPLDDEEPLADAVDESEEDVLEETLTLHHDELGQDSDEPEVEEISAALLGDEEPEELVEDLDDAPLEVEPEIADEPILEDVEADIDTAPIEEDVESEDVAAEPMIEPEPELVSEPEPELEPEPVSEPAPEPEPEPEPAAESEPVPAVAVSAASSAELSDAQLDVLADKVADRLIEKLGRESMKDVIWDVVPELAEAMIKKRIYQLEQSAEE